MSAITITPSRLPMNQQIAKEYGIDGPQWRVLVEQIFPAAKSVESVLMAMAYCKSRNLDIFKKPVHIVPMWSSEKKTMVETVWPGISEIRTTAARTGAYAGIDEIEFGPDKTKTFSGEQNRQRTELDVTFPQWAKATVYRIVKGTRCPFTAVVYWIESYASQGKGDLPNAMWKKRTRGQLAKCAEVAAIRMAFPEDVGNDYAAEEMEGQALTGEHDAKTLTPPPPPEIEEETIVDVDAPSDILAEFETWLENSKTGEEIETAFEQFKHHLETMPDGDCDTMNALYEAALQRVEPNVVGAG